MKIIIIGGGPAGMMAAIKAAEEGNSVTVFEKNNMLGKKLLITGKGRCNITNNIEINKFVENTPGNGKFLYSAFNNYTNVDIVNFLNKNNLETKVERGNRIFPVTDKSIDVLNTFIRKLEKLKIVVKLNSKVKSLIVENKKVIGINLENGKIFADKIILATGGKSYPLTGSTGDGYEMAKELGHEIVDVKPSLVPYNCFEKEMCTNLQGISLKNVKIKIKDIEKNKVIYEEFGEMLFTHFGVSGPIILSSSSHLVRYKNIENLFKENKVKLYIDLKPALSDKQLDARLLREFNDEKNKMFKTIVPKLLPAKFTEIFCSKTKINADKKINEITKLERVSIIENLKEFEITLKSFRPIEEAVITAGGISIREINAQTMESKIIKNLYFAGEIIDVDAYTGGFNLQIAYSTGNLAGKTI